MPGFFSQPRAPFTTADDDTSLQGILLVLVLILTPSTRTYRRFTGRLEKPKCCTLGGRAAAGGGWGTSHHMVRVCEGEGSSHETGSLVGYVLCTYYSIVDKIADNQTDNTTAPHRKENQRLARLRISIATHDATIK